MSPKAKDSIKAAAKETLAEKPKKRAKKRVLGSPFCEYLEKIRTARENAKTASEIVLGSLCDKRKVLVDLILEALFDYFCEGDIAEITPSALNAVAGVVQKLSATAKDEAAKTPSGEIGGETLAQIEDKLKLL